MTTSLAVEWAKYNSRLNAIAPGPFPHRGAWSRLIPSETFEEHAPTQIHEAFSADRRAHRISQHF